MTRTRSIDNLRRERFRTLSLLGDAGLADHRTGGVQPHGDAVLRRDAGAADTVKRGTRIGDFDETGNADAAMNVILAQCRLFSAELVIIHHRHQLVDCGVMRQLLKPQA
jgi:hypothetical protein